MAPFGRGKMYAKAEDDVIGMQDQNLGVWHMAYEFIAGKEAGETMDEDDLNFDFEKTLEEQQKQAANGPSTSQIPASAAIPVNQSEGSFKRNFRQTVCTYWLKGVCALGENCGFLHEYNAERMPVCKNLIRFGVCKEPDCPYKHTLEDIKECNMFKLGFCVYGPECRYRHTRLPGPPPEPSSVDAAKPRDYRAGGRDFGGLDGGRGRGRGRGPYGRGEGFTSGRGPPRPPPFRPAGMRPQQDHISMRPEHGVMGNMGFSHPMMGMQGMMPGMMHGMPMGMPNPFWQMGMGRPPFMPYGYQ